ncbi:UNVERIFIED_CONTAM: hypothetical protein RMT77_012033 [Armadillidium vulgare]
MDSLVFYTSDYLLFRFGKMIRRGNDLRVFVANLVFLMEPSRLINLNEIFEKNSGFNLVSLSFVIENHGLLVFGIHYNDPTILYLKKILSREIRLKSRYCSEIFFYEDAGDDNNLYDLVVYEENNDRLHVLPSKKYQNGHSIGIICGRTRFLREITSPNFKKKIVDIYCTFQILNLSYLSRPPSYKF